jgi:hypothetical protein
MKTLTKNSLAMIAALSITAVTATGPAWAQPEPGFGGGPGMMGGGPGMHGDPQQRWEAMQQRHAQRMQELKKQLNLKPDQQAAWEAFMEAQNTLGQSMHAGWQSLRGVGTTPERFDKMADLMEQRLSSVRDLAKKAHALYDALDAQQKTTLDQFTARPGRLKGKGQNQ